MTIYYVGGGDGSAVSTDPTTGGDWTNTYLDIAAVITAAILANGDTIYFKDTHTETNTANIICFDFLTLGDPNPVSCISVDVNDTSVYKFGAKIICNSSGNFWCSDAVHWQGFDVEIGDVSNANQLSARNSGTQHTFEDCIITFKHGSSEIHSSQDQANFRLINTDMGSDGVANVVTLCQQGAANRCFEWYGGAVIGSVTNLFGTSAGQHRIFGVDLSVITGTLVNGMGAVLTNDDPAFFFFAWCKLNSGVAVANELQDGWSNSIEMWNCDDSTGDENHRFFVRKSGGDAESETSIVRTASQALPGTEQISIKITTDANCSKSNPFKFVIPARFASTGDASDDVLTMYLTSDTSLDDNDVQVRVVYPDATTQVQANVATNANIPTGKPWATNPLASGTALTTSGAVWTNPKTNEYKIAVDTSGDAGLSNPNVAPMVIVSITKPSITLYVDSEVELS